MMKISNKVVFGCLILLLMLSLGCVNQKPQQKPQPTNTNARIEVDPLLAQQVKSTANTIDGVEDSTAVVINKEISAAVKVSGFDRLRLKSIRQQVHQKIRDENQDYTIFITSDKKLFQLLKNIENQLSSGENVSLPELQQKVEKINKDMRG
jgi:ABC-type phosphate transport system auxiliary subunit